LPSSVINNPTSAEPPTLAILFSLNKLFDVTDGIFCCPNYLNGPLLLPSDGYVWYYTSNEDSFSASV
jgi:hypothetical protein